MRVDFGSESRSEGVDGDTGSIDPGEGQLDADLERELLQSLQVVVEQTSALLEQCLFGLFDISREEPSRLTQHDGALGDQEAVAALGAEVGTAQLEAELGRAAGEDEDLGARTALERLASNRSTIKEKPDRQRCAGHLAKVAGVVASVQVGEGEGDPLVLTVYERHLVGESRGPKRALPIGEAAVAGGA